VQTRLVDGALKEVKAFSDAGGQILFGTDVGYMFELDPTEEYELMGQAGLTPMQILASLTTAPAARWNESGKRGTVRAGMAADLVVLNGDPVTDVKQFANVKCTIRGGREIFVRKP
jgi:imidazolonepropionase-like amidohydrolase